MIPIKIERRDDLVRVVRCKDCRHFDRESWDEPMNLLPSYCLKKLPGIGYVMYGNGPESYCSYGERREDNGC